MEIIVVGINYKTAPVAIREKIAFTKSQEARAYEILKSDHNLREAVILSTCNRSEITAVVTDVSKGIIALKKFYYGFFNIEKMSLNRYFITHSHDDAVKHVFKLAAGLESLILGEDQILGQVRLAYENAIEAGSTNVVLNKFYREVITTAKRIKRETNISKNPLSTSSIAVKFIEQIYDQLQNKKVMVIGVGKMSRIAIENLLHRGVKEIIVTNRTKGHAVDLSKRYSEISVIDFKDRYKMIPQIDIIISSTSAPHYVLRTEEFKKYHSSGDQLCMIDIAVPRDVDPDIGTIEGITLYELDDLQKVSLDNMETRIESAKNAVGIIIEECIRFENWYHSLTVFPVIEELQKVCEEMLQQELNTLFPRMESVSPKDRVLIEVVMRSLVKKIIKKPILNLKRAGEDRHGELYGKIASELFGIGNMGCAKKEDKTSE